MNPTAIPENKVSSSRREQPFTPDPAESSANDADVGSIGQNRTVLVVDDNLFVLKAFETKLKASGFQVAVAQDSSTAIGAARTVKPDLIVLDINFPPDAGFTSLQWNGLIVLQWLKRFQEVSQIPVVVISGDDPAKHKKEVLAAGAVAYFQKPLDFKEFVGTLKLLLERQSLEMVNHEI